MQGEGTKPLVIVAGRYHMGQHLAFTTLPLPLPHPPMASCEWCRIDVSPTESSWMLRPLNKVSLGYCVPDRRVPTLDCAPSAAIAASVGLRHLMDQWGVWPASPTLLTRFIGLAPLCWMHARPTHRGSWKSGVASLNQIKGMGWFGQGQIIQGTLCPRDATSKNFRSGTHRLGMD